MINLLGGLQRLILVAVLALASLAVSGLAAPAAHASGPSLYLIGQGGGVYVSGQGFTPGVQLRVEVLNSTLTIVGSTQYLTPTACYYGGCFATVMTATNFTGSAWIAVDQTGFSTVWGQTTVDQDPYITAYTQVGPTSTTFAVAGSGYTPGASVSVQAWQYACIGKLCFPTTLSAQTVTASVATPNDADYGLIYGYPTVPAHSGWVYVSTTGGAPANSNVLSFFIP
jgi:hypothetical protein